MLLYPFFMIKSHYIQLLFLLLSTSSLFSQQKLHNGILLDQQWPPRYDIPSERKEMVVPYLEEKPQVIPINTGRQLFVDSFLIAESDMTPIYHKATYHDLNPVLEPDREWEKTGTGALYAAPFSDGVWYDEKIGKFRMWYLAGAGLFYKDEAQCFYTCYAESEDGIVWTKPLLDVVDGTNIVDKNMRDAATVWIDRNEKDPAKRYKFLNVERDWNTRHYKRWQIVLKYSADGIHWSEGEAQSGDMEDRTTAFYNPFTDKWALSMRYSPPISTRSRSYSEHSDLEQLVSMAHKIRPGLNDKSVVYWFSPDEKELRHHTYPEVEPGIYNFDAIAYESIMLGQYTVWCGPENRDCGKLGIQKRNEISLGYSRDGFHFYRPTHEVFMGVNETDGAWNWGNVQSSNGTPLIVGDSLYFYVSGRRLSDVHWDSHTSTGLATLRRDGFVSMRAEDKEIKTLVTESVTFDGSYMFVNVDIQKRGLLQVELLDKDGNVIEGYSKADCKIIRTNSTKQLVTWKKQATVEALKDQAVKIKFYMKSGDLYSFWVSPWESGESRGYTAGGGPKLSAQGVDIPQKL